MPRTARQKSSTGFYHVIGRGINREHIFYQVREKNTFIKFLQKHLEKYGIEIYAYVIMSTHFHILLHAEIKLLSGYIAIVLAEFAEYYNYKHNRNGHVFQDRFKSECVETPQYFWNCIRYIHMNPVHAGMVKNPLKYKYSSLKEYETEKCRIIHPEAVKNYKETFTDFDEYLEFHNKSFKHIFLDIPDDVELQRRIVAKALIIQQAHILNLDSPKEIIEDVQLRNAFKDNLQKELRISKANSERLFCFIKRCIIEK